AGDNGDSGIIDWLSSAVEQMIDGQDAAAQAWRAIETASGEAVLRRKSADEEDWMIAIGLRKDTLPFRVALQLAEPSESQSWMLRPVLQNRNGGEWLPIRRSAQGSGWEFEHADDHSESIQAEWLPHMET